MAMPFLRKHKMFYLSDLYFDVFKKFKFLLFIYKLLKKCLKVLLKLHQTVSRYLHLSTIMKLHLLPLELSRYDNLTATFPHYRCWPFIPFCNSADLKDERKFHLHGINLILLEQIINHNFIQKETRK